MAGGPVRPPLSCLPVSLYPDFRAGRMTVARWAAAAARFGLDAIDLSVLITRADRSPAGFPVDAIAAYTDFTHPDDAERERQFAQFTDDVADCARLGAAYLRVTAGEAHPATSREEGLAWAETYLRRAAEFARGRGVALLFENHSRPGVWRHDDFAGPPDVYFEMIDRIRGTGIALLFDTANACYYRQDPVPMLEKILPRVRRLHVADILDAPELKPTRIGSGMVPLRDLFAFLKRMRYDGGLSIEEASFTGLDGVRRAVDTTRDLWANAL